MTANLAQHFFARTIRERIVQSDDGGVLIKVGDTILSGGVELHFIIRIQAKDILQELGIRRVILYHKNFNRVFLVHGLSRLKAFYTTLITG
jgi:hypothetical protein